jgi:response regulator RpfG family c-di-GMP phosphodiesterase
MNRHGIPASVGSASADPSQQLDTRQQNIQHILVVEDDPTLAALEVEVLTAHGYTVVTAHSGELAITTLRHLIPDLVVMAGRFSKNCVPSPIYLYSLHQVQ